MKVPYIKSEEDFLNLVNKYQSIGFGRMMQIVSFAYHQSDPLACFVSGDCLGMLSEKDKEEYLAIKKSDPLDYSIIKPRKYK